MKPILKYLKDLFASQRVIGLDTDLSGLVRADALLQSLIDAKKVPGLAITLLKNGNTIFQKGYGYADWDVKKPVDPRRTIFRIASVSKPIAATALANMVSDGLMDLDTSFYHYVPYYPKKKYDFTIRQLASHTAGIRGYKGKEYALNVPYSIKESLAVFKDDDLLFKPGTNYFYNSYDWVLISLAMQEASGIPFENYVQQKVLRPLNLKNTFPETAAVSTKEHIHDNEIAVFYSKTRSGFRKAIPVNNFYKMAGGGYLSTSEDIAQLGMAYLDQKITDKTILSQFLTSEILNGAPTYYGLGWQVSMDKTGKPYYGHIGNGVGGYSNFFVYPDEQTVVVILMNCTDPKVQKELDEAISNLLLHMEKPNT
ncbi:MAG: serine hydrolase domain-containing protein [Bacteroidota bacterium]